MYLNSTSMLMNLPFRTLGRVSGPCCGKHRVLWRWNKCAFHGALSVKFVMLGGCLVPKLALELCSGRYVWQSLHFLANM